MRKLILILSLLLLSKIVDSQTFTHSGYVYNSNEVGLSNIPIKIYKRTTPNITGFTSQTNYNSHSYYRSTGSMIWTDAKQACIGMGGHLVTIANESEQTFVFNTWPSGWIGFSDESVEGNFVWVTGEPVTYTNWNPGEPNNAGNEDYAQFVGGGKWNDLPNTSLPYVIEFEYIVTTTPWVLETTVYTNSLGLYSINLPTNPSVEWYIEIGGLTMPFLTPTDAQSPLQITLGITPLTSKKYYTNDVNNDGRINVADSWYIYGKMNSVFGSWGTSPDYRIFNTTQWNIIKVNTSDLRTTYPGVQTMTITSPVSGGSTNFYLLRTGYTQ
jgi:hypothetical protein